MCDKECTKLVVHSQLGNLTAWNEEAVLTICGPMIRSLIQKFKMQKNGGSHEIGAYRLKCF